MESFEVLAVLFFVVILIGVLFFYKINKEKNSEIKNLTTQNQNLEIKNSELMVNLNNANNFEKSLTRRIDELKNENNQLKDPRCPAVGRCVNPGHPQLEF
jgi:predicted PurR-regulated permease PerM